MASPKKINLGVFAAGEHPFPFVHTFRDANQQPIDLTGWTESVYIEGPDENVTTGAGTVQITNAAGGEVTYSWHDDDFVGIGKYRMLLWVTDGTINLASDLVTYETYDGPGVI